MTDLDFKMSSEIDPTELIDLCQNGCTPDAVTPWVDEVCGCCGGIWGEGEAGKCRGVHLIGWTP